VLDLLYDKLADDAFVIIDDYEVDACRQAVDEFRARRGITAPIERVDWRAATWRRSADDRPLTDDEHEARREAALLRRAPVTPAVPGIPRLDLTVVVVFYNMKREAARTLHSLSRAYQQGLDDVTYEVIAVENGSDADQKLGKEFVQSFGPEFRYVSLGANEARPSPVHALNVGIEKGKGDHFALMIDGAHVLTPGVLRYGLTGLATYEPAIVSTQQWYLGPGQQGEAMTEGYDQAFEDRLFDQIQWPLDGYRLFDIGQFIGERDWLDGMWESNCLFAPRSLLHQLGGFDESFDLPGGEYANLDIYERLASSPDVHFTTILGEGSFHQVHGGTTTNQPEIEKRRNRIASYAEHYAELRGRGFKGHQKRIHYVGTMFHEANRTRARRRWSGANFSIAGSPDPDSRPATPTPIPEQLQDEYTEAFWRSLRWKQTSWLGQKVPRSATDLFVYQELISSIRPEWIIETTPGNGGRALFLASICDLLDSGRVLSIGSKDGDDLPVHPRVTYIKGPCFGEDTTARVRDIVGDEPNALVILGSRGRRLRMVNEFETLQPFVPVGSYVIVEETIVNGHPVWASFGPGPSEAVKGILGNHADFIADTDAQRYGVTFNPGGFLKRIPTS
jgi:cephalosporin hydroxylase/glycosyltransferase involved in cell wall biosynthesis